MGDTSLQAIDQTSAAKAEHEDVPPDPPRSLLARFLDVRSLSREKPPQVLTNSRSFRKERPTLLPLSKSRPAWCGYTKRGHRDRIDFYRGAMRVPDDSYSESYDVYNPKKRPTRFIKIHEEADDVNRLFNYRTRCLFFERDVVDQPVCDLFDNQKQYDEELDRIYREEFEVISASAPFSP